MVPVGEEETLADFVSAVEPYPGKSAATNLDEDDTEALRRAMRKAE